MISAIGATIKSPDIVVIIIIIVIDQKNSAAVEYTLCRWTDAPVYGMSNCFTAWRSISPGTIFAVDAHRTDRILY